MTFGPQSAVVAGSFRAWHGCAGWGIGDEAVTAHLDSFDNAQLQAVLARLEGDVRATSPLLIVAGAGTGKTRTMAHRIAELVLRGSTRSGSCS